MRFYYTLIHINSEKKIKMYVPMDIPKQLRAIDPISYTRVILGNSEAFKFLKEIFNIAAQINEEGALFYIPNQSITPKQLREIWPVGNFELGLLIKNYHLTQLDKKEVLHVIDKYKKVTRKSETCFDILEQRNSKAETNYWEINKKLCTKSYNKVFEISTSREVFLRLAHDVSTFIGLKNDPIYNFDYHRHEDNIGTKEDNGLDFYYYLGY